ncbi:hypothetical protein KC957_03875 [Candidatus Saccharibacteria bacterium]|nr:hypothetical protein [Candidatus Saccharibacteria bacterium]
MKKVILTLLVLVSSALFVGSFAPQYAHAAASKDDICAGLESGGGSCDPAAGGSTTLESVIQTAVNILSWIVGILAVIMIIVGGAKYVMSGGESSSVQSAKNTIMYALIGIVIVALAQVIVQFTVRKATKTSTPQQACTATITSGCVDPATGEAR